MFPPILLVTLSALPAAPPTPTYFIETADVRRVEATLTYNVRCDKLKAKEWIVFAAQAPELSGQRKVESRLEPLGTVTKDLSPLKRSILFARVPARQKDLESSIPIRIVYQATLRSRTLKRLPKGAAAPKVEPLDDKEREAALIAWGDLDYKSEAFQSWLTEQKLHRGQDETDVDFARRVFRTIRKGFRYEFRSGMDRRAKVVCQSGRSDCGGLSGLFVATLRASDVPARALYGRWAKSSSPDDKLGDAPYYQAHVKAEFYADGVGWVPVDLASGILHDKTNEGLTYFGKDLGDFLTIHIDPGLELDTRTFGRQKVHNLQEPADWATGSGSAEGRTVKEGWVVKKLP
jgi:transglutaminase-like putative cysteine protease